MHAKLRLLVFVMGTIQIAHAQSSDQVTNYINTYRFLAIAEMQRTGVPAAVILAQGIHETQAGTSDLVHASNNHFGIKCKTGWAGEVVYHDDDARGECFRSYATAADSYRDHSDYLTQTPRYSFLFKLDPEDYESWAYGLKKAGYATNVRYSLILIKLINDYNLQEYSLIALGKRPMPSQPADGTLAKAMRESIPGFVDSIPAENVHTTSTTPGADKLPSISYPDGQFTINATKVIYVKEGVSLLSLSNEYNIPLARLLDFNDMHQEVVLSHAQLIYLQRKRKTGSTPFHIVQPGESLYTICQTEGIRYDAILELNLLKSGEEPAPGEKISLQNPLSSKPLLRGAVRPRTFIPSSK